MSLGRKLAVIAVTVAGLLALNYVFEYGGQVVFGATPRFFPQMISSQTYLLGGVQITNQSLMIIVVAVVMMFGLEFIVHRTKIGKAMRATSYNLSVATLMGINTDFIIAFTFALGSALAAGEHYTEAVPELERALGISPASTFVLNNLGSIYLRKRDHGRALDYWNRSLAVEPGQPTIRAAVDAVRSRL